MERNTRDTNVQKLPVNKKIFKTLSFILILISVTLISNLILNYNMVNRDLQWIQDTSFSLGLLLLSSIILMPSLIILTVLTNSLLNSSLILIFISAIISFSNSNKLMLRNEPMYPQDLTFLTSIDDLLLMISAEQRTTIYILTALLVITVIVVIILHRQYELRFFKNLNKSLFTRSILVIFLMFTNFYIFNFNNKSNLVSKISSSLGFYDARWDQKLLYEMNGFVLGFANNFPGQAMEKPIDYSKQQVTKVLAEYSKKADLINQTRKNDVFNDVSVVYILSESFSDPNMIDGVDLNTSPVQYVKKVKDKAHVGNVIVPSYGDGTPNSEFEILTGMSIQHLVPNMALPFQDFLSSYNTFPSFVSEFKSNENNKTVSLHSFTPDMYKRPSVYETLGFDEQLYRDNMRNPEGVENSVYVSDASVYSDIVGLLDEYEDNLFIHTVTMQNHAPYYKQFYNSDFKMVSKIGERSEEIINFAQGVSITDKETKALIKSISKMDRNIIVVFYGDHIPGLYEEYSERNNSLNFARTPYFVYSNFSEPTLSLEGDQSLTLMNNLVKDLADVKITAFDALVLELRSNIPAGRFDQYVNFDGSTYEYSDLNKNQKKLLSDFRLIQYDIITGKKYSLE